MQANCDVLIFYEHVSRELAALDELAKRLTARGMSVAVRPVHFGIYRTLLVLRPKAVVLPYLYSFTDSFVRWYERLYGQLPTLVILHNEQVSDRTTASFRLPRDQVTRDAMHVSWGNAFASELMAAGVPHERIFVCGSIRAAVSAVSPYESGAGSVLFACSFSRAFVSAKKIESLLAKNPIDRELYAKKIQVTSESLNAWITTLVAMCEKYPGEHFVLRPHPYVTEQAYVRRIREVAGHVPENLSVSMQGAIQDAIATSKCVVAWTSTVVVDAYLARKRFCLYQPIALDPYMIPELIRSLPVMRSAEDLEQFCFGGSEAAQFDSEFEAQVQRIYGDGADDPFELVARVVQAAALAGPVSWSLRPSVAMKLAARVVLRDVVKDALNSIGVLGSVLPAYRGVERDNLKLDFPRAE